MNQTAPAHLFSERLTGIYESLRAYDGVLFCPTEHLERFFESAKTLGLKVPKTREEIAVDLKKALNKSGKKDAFVRLTLMGTPAFLSIIVIERKHPHEIYQKGVSLRTAVVRRNSSNSTFPEAKSTDCMNQVLATLEPAPSGNYEILFLNAEGYLTEARIGNLFMVTAQQSPKGVSRLITPPPNGLLNGVTRRFVIECARRGKIPVEERPLTRHELFNAGEAFLTNTSWEILPIREVDGRKIGDAVPGGVTKKLQRIFKEQVQKEIRRAKD